MRGLSIVLLLAGLAGCERAPDGGAASGAGEPGGMMRRTMAGAIDTAGLRTRAVPADLASGERFFAERCVSCHGEAALGTDVGPPLVHIYYEPNHHGDAAFVFAAERGVRAHHWNFGDMPPVPGVSRIEVMEIVAYVRWLQREAGVY